MPLLAGGSFNLLAVEPGLAIWTAITFTIVLAILWRFAWKPIIEALDARNAKVENDLEESKRLREEAESLLKEYEDKLNTSKEEAVALIDEAKADASKLCDNIIAEANNEAERLKKNSLTDIEQAKVKALSELEAGVVQLSLQILSGVLKNRFTKEEHQKLIEAELASIKENNEYVKK